MGNKSKKTDADKRGMIWTEHWDDVLIEALVHQQSMGNRVDKVFTTAAYDNVVKELREKIGEPFEKGHLKNRLKTLKHKFNECHDIFSGMNDFIWSPNTKMWNAQPEVWKALIKVRPDARKWIFTPIANYNKLVMLFGKEKSDCVYDTKEEAHQWVNLGNLSKFNCVDHVMSHNEVTLTPADLNGMKDGNDQLPTSVEAKSQIDSQVPSQSATSLNARKRKAPRNFDFSREFASIREAIKDVAAAIREGNAITERGRPRVYSEQEVFAELVNIGVDSQLRYRAYTFLISNVGRVRAFFGCPSEERRDFLLQMMYSPHDC